MDDAERRQLAAVSRAYYLEDVPKVDIAAAHGFSRFKVARMLRRARETGIVTIEVHDDGGDRHDLATALAGHLLLSEAVVVPAGESEDADRRRTARAASELLTARTREGDVLGFSWGRTIAVVGECLRSLPPATVVPLTGTVGHDPTRSPIEVVRRIAAGSPVQTLGIFSPMFASSPEAARALRADPAIAEVLARYADLTTAVLSVGSWDPPVTQLAAFLGADDRTELDRQGAVAELAGIFVRADGTPVESDLAARRISVSVDELLATPRVIAVAGSSAKVDAIHALARSGLVTTLVTDDRTAALLLRRPRVAAHALPPRRPGHRATGR